MCEHHRPEVFHKRDVMSPAMFRKVFDEVKDSARIVSMTVSGDAFADRRLNERLEMIKNSPQVGLEIVTNGALLDEKRFALFSGMRNHLYLSVSLDSIDPDIYRTIRAPGELSDVLVNLRNFRDWAAKYDIPNFHLNVSMVAMKRNVGGLVEFVEAAHSYGAESIGVSHVTVFEERDKFDSLFWWPKETNDIIARGRKRAKELGMAFYAPPPFAVTPNEIATYKTAPLPPCPYLEGRLYVGFDGKIEACCHNQRPIMGNASSQRLGEIWNSQSYHDLRTSIFAQAPKSPCDNCYILESYKPYLYDSRAFGIDVFAERGEPAEAQIAARVLKNLPPPADTEVNTAPAFASTSTGDLLKAEKIAHILRCPSCYSTVTISAPRITCNGCGAEYVFESGAPVLMTPADRVHLGEFMARHTAQTVPAIHSALRRRFFPPSPTYDPRRKHRLPKLWERFGQDKIIVDVGAQSQVLRTEVINFDMAAFPGINLVGNALRLPIATRSVDLIINTGVLEHVEDLDRVVAEFHRVLRPGGVVYTEIPFMQGYHPDPTDFQRLTFQGLERAFRHFVIEEMDISSGPWSNLTWLLRELAASLFNSERKFTWVWMLTGWATFWLKYFDAIALRGRFAHRVASSYYVIARKV
jgi:radical SAM protein with 4Fe4S-binding SPASM domain